MRSNNVDPLCCFCGRPTPRHNPRETFTLNLGQDRGPRVVLCWHHAGGCAVSDPLCTAIAEADALPDAEAGDLQIAAVYLRLLDRLASEHGAEVLRAAVDVRRDADDPRVTLRGPGLLWGRRSARGRR